MDKHENDENDALFDPQALAKVLTLTAACTLRRWASKHDERAAIIRKCDARLKELDEEERSGSRRRGRRQSPPNDEVTRLKEQQEAQARAVETLTEALKENQAAHAARMEAMQESITKLAERRADSDIEEIRRSHEARMNAVIGEIQRSHEARMDDMREMITKLAERRSDVEIAQIRQEARMDGIVNAVNVLVERMNADQAGAPRRSERRQHRRLPARLRSVARATRGLDGEPSPVDPSMTSEPAPTLVDPAPVDTAGAPPNPKRELVSEAAAVEIAEIESVALTAPLSARPAAEIAAVVVKAGEVLVPPIAEIAEIAEALSTAVADSPSSEVEVAKAEVVAISGPALITEVKAADELTPSLQDVEVEVVTLAASSSASLASISERDRSSESHDPLAATPPSIELAEFPTSSSPTAAETSVLTDTSIDDPDDVSWGSSTALCVLPEIDEPEDDASRLIDEASREIDTALAANARGDHRTANKHWHRADELATRTCLAKPDAEARRSLGNLRLRRALSMTRAGDPRAINISSSATLLAFEVAKARATPEHLTELDATATEYQEIAKRFGRDVSGDDLLEAIRTFVEVERPVISGADDLLALMEATS